MGYMEIGLLLLRLTAGLTLAAHGTQKLFGWFGGPDLEATGQLFETLGFLPGRRQALLPRRRPRVESTGDQKSSPARRARWPRS